METNAQNIRKAPKYLGFAGLMPPAMMLASVAFDPTLRWIAIASAFGYSAVIFSFLGGIWWGLAIASGRAPPWIWFAAVSPAIISFVLFMPWILGWDWPQQTLMGLALFILLSPGVDRLLKASVALPPGWLRLRMQLSFGLAGLTFILSQI